MDGITFVNAYLITKGKDRRRSPHDCTYTNDATVQFYSANGLFGGACFGVLFEPELNDFWSDLVINAIDIRASDYDFTIFNLDVDKAPEVLLRQWEDRGVRDNPSTWIMLEVERDDLFLNIYDIRTSMVLYLETAQPLIQDNGDYDNAEKIIRFMERWNHPVISQVYNDLLVSRVSLGQSWEQLAAFNISSKKSKNRDDFVYLPRSVFNLIELMSSCRQVEQVMKEIKLQMIFNNSAEDYFKIANKDDPIRAYNTGFLDSIEHWYSKKDIARDLLCSIERSHEIINIKLFDEKDILFNLSPGLTDEREVYNCGVIQSILNHLDKRCSDLQALINQIDLKAEFLLSHLNQRIGITMHKEVVYLNRSMVSWAKTAIAVALISLLIQSDITMSTLKHLYERLLFVLLG